MNTVGFGHQKRGKRYEKVRRRGRKEKSDGGEKKEFHQKRGERGQNNYDDTFFDPSKYASF